MKKTLSIVIPAYNEEEAIDEILTRCLDARKKLCEENGLASVEVIAVDDGSRDKTKELASKYKEAKLVVHPVNRGYGAALMTGFEAASGDYLSFLDADGTCDPLAFTALCQALEKDQADMAVGNRLHGKSEMPLIREIGNRFYALLISALSGVEVHDTASGMRVFKRELLPKLSPLPTGLHFTPAMTARAACMGAKLVETPIPYAERQGESKLNVAADGLRFLRVILGTIFAYSPMKIFGPMGLFFLAVAFAYGLGPVAYYAEHRHLQDAEVIYRLLTILTLGACGFIALCSGAVAQKISDLAVGRPPRWYDARWVGEAAIALGIALGLGGVALNTRTIVEYVSHGSIQTPWVYVLAGGLCVIVATVLVSFGVTVWLVEHLPRARERK